jgi:hypothetical protein
MAGLLLASLVGADFDSVFLFVTGAFNFSGAGFASARDEGFAFDGTTAFAVVFGAAVATVFVTPMPGVFALPAGWVATAFLTAGFAIDLLDADLVAAEFAFFAGDVVFAVFFIAFAMESIPKWIALVCAE